MSDNSSAGQLVHSDNSTVKTAQPFGQLNGSDNSTLRTDGQDKLTVERPTSVTVMFTRIFLYKSCDSIIYQLLCITRKCGGVPVKPHVEETSVSDYVLRDFVYND